MQSIENCPEILLFMFSRQLKFSYYRITVARDNKMSLGWPDRGGPQLL